MRTSQRFIFTVLIAVFITGAFALVAYTGLFRLLETDFFSSRVKSDQRVRLGNISDTIFLWNQENLSRFDALSRDRNMQSVFSISQRQEEILYRAQLSDSLKDQLLGFNGVRVVDNDDRIQFSSFAGDISSRRFGVDSRILYRVWNELDESFEFPDADENSVAVTYYDEANQQVRYRLPMQDWGFVTRGWMIVYMNLSGLTDRLARDGLIAQGASLYIVEGRGIIADIRPEQAAAVEEKIDVLWPIDGVPSEFSVLAEGLDGKYWLGGTISSDGTWVGKLIPGHLFGLSTAVRMLILATVFLTSTLLVFLLFNLRQDRMDMLRGRIRRLQVNLLQNWLEHHEGRKLSLKDFETRREEVRTELRNGLGKLKEDESTKADEIIDEGWTRIAGILAENESDTEAASIGVGTAMEQAPIDMRLLEDMIARAISAAQIATPQIQHAQPPLQAGQRRLVETEKVSELVEEFDEAEEIVEEPTERESDEIGLDADAGELAGAQEVEPVVSQTMVEPDDKELSETDASPEALEVLPVVLADDFGELVEIGKVKQDKMYTFDGAPDAIHEDVIDNLESLDEDDERYGDLEELDEPGNAGKLDSKSGSSSTERVMFIPVAEVVRQYSKLRSNEVNDGDEHFEHSDPIESLINSEITDVLPEAESGNGDLHFAHESSELSWREDGLDYDRYLREFESGSTGVCKSLMKLSKEYRAICGTLFLSSKKGLVTDYTVGLSDECAAQLSVARGEKLWTEWFEKRLLVFIPDLPNSPYASRTEHYEFRYIRAAIFIPIIYSGTSSYLFLGFKEVPEDLMGLLVGVTLVK